MSYNITYVNEYKQNDYWTYLSDKSKQEQLKKSHC